MQWQLGSGEGVVDRHRSHIHGNVVRLLPEALRHIHSSGRQFIIEEIDFGQSIGETICVTTGHGDQILFAQRPGRFGLSRFVKDRAPEQCSKIVVILKKAEEDDYYVLITAFIGHKPEPEPWDRNATPRSIEFWSGRALVWGSEPIVPGTETVECPW
ncbi:MAG: hypothetical protein Q8P73_00235 [bacterium]|nr:hypothetical protein [bacterium]